MGRPLLYISKTNPAKSKEKILILIIISVMSLLLMRAFVSKNDEDDTFYETTTSDQLTTPSDRLKIQNDSLAVPVENIYDKNIPNFPPDAYYIEPSIIPFSSALKKYEMIMVTGASANHFCVLKGFLYRLKLLKVRDFGLIVYDLGLTKKQRGAIQYLQKLGYISEFRTFNFDVYPKFWNILKSRGEYGWKVGIIAEVTREFSGKFLAWMDTGDGLSKNFFANLEDLLNKSGGFISARSSGSMSTWTHKGVYEYFKDDHRLYDDLPNCSSGVVVFDMNESHVSRRVIDEWYKCALNKECIAPSGSSRQNHRQDQAIITYLFARRGIYCNITREELSIETNLDRTCQEDNKFYERKYGLNFKQFN